MSRTSQKKATYDMRKAAGLCVCCCRKVEFGQTRCTDCRERKRQNGNKQRDAWIAAGCCGSCGKTLQQFTFPLHCDSVHPRCVVCIFKGHARVTGEKTLSWKALASRFLAQECRCALSGIPLTLNLNTSLDHIIARSNGGPHTLDNVWFLDTNVNKAKGIMSVAQFRSMCRSVLVVSGELVQ